MQSGTSVTNPHVTIAVCSRNRPHQLQRWVAQMTALVDQHPTPLLIIEQSAQATPLPPHPLLTHIHAPGRGLSRARNRVLQAATSAFVAFCDDDCVPSASWVTALYAALAAYPDAAVITGSTWPYAHHYTLYAHHTHAGYTAWATRADGMCCTALQVSATGTDVTHPVAILEQLGQGNHMVVARQIALNHGGFHPWLGAGAWLHAGEDVEFMLRLLGRHQRCCYQPAMRLYHDAWQPAHLLAHAEHGYTTGMLAVHVWYALYGDATAQAYLRFRWQQLWHTATTPTTPAHPPRGRRWWWQRAWAWGLGILGGLVLALRAAWSQR